MSEAKAGCALCGARFKNTFEAVAHADRNGKEFNPKIILGVDNRLGIGTLLRKIFYASSDEFVKTAVEDAYALLYIAEKRPEALSFYYSLLVKSLEREDEDFSLSEFVYKIVSEDAFKEMGL